MPMSNAQTPSAARPPQEPPTVSAAGRWQIHEYAEVPSTNLVAAGLPAWHAVRADTQVTGRGRFQREWISDHGGLWMSGVLPLEAKSPGAPILPLAAGLALCDVLRDLGVKELQMRWPNDVLVGGRKLAGLLVDRFVAGLAVVGVGLNVTNDPEARDPRLQGQVSRLAALMASPPPIGQLMHAILLSLEATWRELHTGGPEGFLARINALWRTPVAVALDLDGPVVTGDFHGVDSSGRLKLCVSGAQTQLFEPHHVRLLRELS
jgi:BirA family biotin operon repressor/biotin-[acetyl-CoA-carboxylase] ligase